MTIYSAKSFNTKTNTQMAAIGFSAHFIRAPFSVHSLPDFIARRTRYKSVNYGISNYSLKEHIETHKIPKFGVNQASFDRATGI